MKVSVAGTELALQTLELKVPADQDVRGLTFVLRSADSSRWWRDGAPLYLPSQCCNLGLWTLIHRPVPAWQVACVTHLQVGLHMSCHTPNAQARCWMCIAGHFGHHGYESAGTCEPSICGLLPSNVSVQAAATSICPSRAPRGLRKRPRPTLRMS